ncbi:MAG: hypothetical protein KAV82_14715 [Phycisphaerae bacterium]|nr:hypothetical protein [Phycisphaerae bacterium]
MDWKRKTCLLSVLLLCTGIAVAEDRILPKSGEATVGEATRAIPMTLEKSSVLFDSRSSERQLSGVGVMPANGRYVEKLTPPNQQDQGDRELSARCLMPPKQMVDGPRGLRDCSYDQNFQTAPSVLVDYCSSEAGYEGMDVMADDFILNPGGTATCLIQQIETTFQYDSAGPNDPQNDWDGVWIVIWADGGTIPATEPPGPGSCGPDPGGAVYYELIPMTQVNSQDVYGGTVFDIQVTGLSIELDEDTIYWLTIAPVYDTTPGLLRVMMNDVPDALGSPSVIYAASQFSVPDWTPLSGLGIDPYDVAFALLGISATTTGACCYEEPPGTFICTNGVKGSWCSNNDGRWAEGKVCEAGIDQMDPPCGEGACCRGITCTDYEEPAECSDGLYYLGEMCATGPSDPDGVHCPPPNDLCTSVTPVAGGACDASTNGGVGVCWKLTGRIEGATDAGCPQHGNTAWEAFIIEEPMQITIDYCGSDPRIYTTWIFLMPDCDCENAEFTILADFTSRESDLGSCCRDDPPGYDPLGNLVMIFDCVPAGTWYLPILYNLPENNYIIHIHGIPCEQIASNPDPGHETDCNGNMIIDDVDLYVNETSTDCNENGLPDECDCGDWNGNGTTDRYDYQAFQACFAGPVTPVTECDCAFFDLTNDGYVDLADFWVFQQCYGPCAECPDGGAPEGEETCYEGYFDDYNGGCFNLMRVNQTFVDLDCDGTVYCGELGQYDGKMDCLVNEDCPTGATCSGGFCTTNGADEWELRDTDWYRFTIAEETYVSLEVTAEIAVDIWIIDARVLVPDTYCPETLSGFTLYLEACETGTLSVCLPPGTYYPLVMDYEDDIECGLKYTATLSCEPCDIPGDHCLNAWPIDANTNFLDLNFDATPLGGMGPDGDTPAGSPSCQYDEDPDAPVHSLWYSFVATATSVEIKTCNTYSAAEGYEYGINDTILVLYGGDCGGLTELACNEDACGENGYLSWLCYEGLTIDETYYVYVANSTTADYSIPGVFQLDVTSPCPEQPCAPCATGTSDDEPVCADEYVDVTNGGCLEYKFGTPAWTSINNGDTVCGSNGVFSTTNLPCDTAEDCPGTACVGNVCEGGPWYSFDYDWYMLEVHETSSVTWSVKAEYAARAGAQAHPILPPGMPCTVTEEGGEIIDVDCPEGYSCDVEAPYPASGFCNICPDGVYTVEEYMSFCDEEEIGLIVPPGKWALFVAPEMTMWNVNNLPCTGLENHYEATLTVEPYEEMFATPGETCLTAPEITTNGGFWRGMMNDEQRAWEGAAGDWPCMEGGDYCPMPCAAGFEYGVVDVWFKYVAPCDGRVTFHTCNEVTDVPTVIGIWTIPEGWSGNCVDLVQYDEPANHGQAPAYLYDMSEGCGGGFGGDGYQFERHCDHIPASVTATVTKEVSVSAGEVYYIQLMTGTHDTTPIEEGEVLFEISECVTPCPR